ncbi:type II secretion system F family protein [Lactobacillus ultunensis]|uniref:Bacterial type II secretion system domain protein F n=1 Tax=Lactobacillus ultunensis DSM 16047 TaxID=525365 RepID=C2EM69_9LACO|nr:type II secretion system F family protein [Lactobacillus ultunensis]EEJ72346.1 bacterial type II secretion system domain protein F [Lactobacillus ultunensis DSM 16047]QQP27961.1 type II secretion system F family protein [Lactobacillus ultunensis]
MKYISNSNKDRLNSEEQLAFLDYLKHSLDNGFSLINSIELMPALWPKREELMQKLADQMKEGASFSTELVKLVFSKTTVTQVNLALQQGNLTECLNQLATLNRLKQEQVKKLRSELSYPLVLAIMMVILLVFMQSFVSTQFSSTSEHSGDIVMLGLIVLVMTGIYFFVRIVNLLNKQDYESMKKLVKYPIIGPVIALYVNYLLVYDIGMLLASGFSLQRMCEYASEQERGSLQQALGQKIGHQLAEGRSLEEIVEQEEFLPNSLLILLQTGSERKSLSQRCLILGRSLFLDLTEKIEKLVVNVQPVCFILIGLCIIGMYLKLLLPMYSMMQGI